MRKYNREINKYLNLSEIEYHRVYGKYPIYYIYTDYMGYYYYDGHVDFHEDVYLNDESLMDDWNRELLEDYDQKFLPFLERERNINELLGEKTNISNIINR